jgi:hypothetical protein
VHQLTPREALFYQAGVDATQVQDAFAVANLQDEVLAAV